MLQTIAKALLNKKTLMTLIKGTAAITTMVVSGIEMKQAAEEAAERAVARQTNQQTKESHK